MSSKYDIERLVTSKIIFGPMWHENDGTLSWDLIICYPLHWDFGP
jgi:hypothetical protein